MSDFESLRRFLVENRMRLSARTSDPDAFARELTYLIAYWDEEDDPAVRTTETWRVINRYPRVRADVLRAGLADTPTGAPDPEIAPGGPQVADRAPAARSASTADGPTDPPEQPGNDRAVRAAFGGPGRPVPAREITAGVLAVIIVGVALFILVMSVFRVTEPGRTAAKDALVFVNAVLGVVLGYYFGRIPGEGRAESAEAEARRARTELDRTVGEVRGVINAAAAGTRGFHAELTLTSQQLDQLRNALARLD